MFPGFRVVAAAFILSSAMFLACSTNTTQPVPHPTPLTPVADTPAHAVETFRWAWESRSFDTYRTLFTDDFQFAFAALDTNGNSWRTTPWSRDDELLSFTHLISGGGTSAPAYAVTLVLDNLLLKTDPRPGRSDRARYRLATAGCNLSVQFSDGFMANVRGRIDLYLSRGDVAALPEDLGRSPDSTAWYVERWEDQTLAPAVQSASAHAGARLAAAQATRNWTWGLLKTLYRESGPASGATAPRP